MTDATSYDLARESRRLAAAREEFALVVLRLAEDLAEDPDAFYCDAAAMRMVRLRTLFVSGRSHLAALDRLIAGRSGMGVATSRPPRMPRSRIRRRGRR